MNNLLASSVVEMIAISMLSSIYLFFSTTHPVSALGYTVDSFCTGAAHACAVINQNQTKCWGYQYSFGSSFSVIDGMGDDPGEVRNGIPFISFGSVAPVQSIHCGGYHTCAILSQGSLKCLGEIATGKLGLGLGRYFPDKTIGIVNGYIGDALPVVSIGTGLSVLAAALGKAHTCVKVTGNNVKCFGNNGVGQLGLGDSTTRGREPSEMGDSLPIINFGTGVTVSSVHTGVVSEHNCIVVLTPSNEADRIKCWGYNINKQLGYGTAFSDSRGDAANEMGDNLPLVDLGTESRVRQVSLGGIHTCAILFSDILKCWGGSDFGQLGSGSTATISVTGNSLPSVLIDSGKTIKLLSTGDSHTCIVYDDDLTMKCVGWNYYGQLAQGSIDILGDDSSETIPNIPAINLGTGALKIEYIYAGSDFNCVFFVDDSVKCFGNNGNGQLALGKDGSIGDELSELGAGLPFANFASEPTKAPTRSPTKSPVPPTPPTQAPTKSPTNPTKNPTAKPTKSPSKTPSKNPTKVPFTKVPTTSPTPKVSDLSDNFVVRLDLGPLNKTEAEAACLRLYGTHLATYTSGTQVYEVQIMVNYKDFWIGLNDIDEEGEFEWTSNSNSTQRSWDKSDVLNPQPINTDDKDCVIGSGMNGQWTVVECSNKYSALVCDRPKSVSPTLNPTKKPATPTLVARTAMPTVTGSPTSSTAESSTSNASVAIGLGVSIPLVAIGAAAGIFFAKYRGKKSVSEMIPDSLSPSKLSLMNGDQMIELVEKKRKM